MKRFLKTKAEISDGTRYICTEILVTVTTFWLFNFFPPIQVLLVYEISNLQIEISRTNHLVAKMQILFFLQIFWNIVSWDDFSTILVTCSCYSGASHVTFLLIVGGLLPPLLVIQCREPRLFPRPQLPRRFPRWRPSWFCCLCWCPWCRWCRWCPCSPWSRWSRWCRWFSWFSW